MTALGQARLTALSPQALGLASGAISENADVQPAIEWLKEGVSQINNAGERITRPPQTCPRPQRTSSARIAGCGAGSWPLRWRPSKVAADSAEASSGRRQNERFNAGVFLAATRSFRRVRWAITRVTLHQGYDGIRYHLIL